MATRQQRIAEAYIMVKEDPGTLYDMKETIESLKVAVRETNGNADEYGALRLNEMTALELIAHIAPNGIRFIM